MKLYKGICRVRADRATNRRTIQYQNNCYYSKNPRNNYFTSSQAEHLGFRVSAWWRPQYKRPALQKYTRSTKSSRQTAHLKHPGCQLAVGPALAAQTPMSPEHTPSPHWNQKDTTVRSGNIILKETVHHAAENIIYWVDESKERERKSEK